MITSDTVTDAQIRELRSHYDPDDKEAETCNLALFLDGDPWTYRAARECCANLINRRAMIENRVEILSLLSTALGLVGLSPESSSIEDELKRLVDELRARKDGS